MLKIDELMCNEDKAKDLIFDYKKQLLMDVCELRKDLKLPESNLVIDKLMNRLLLSYLAGNNPFSKKHGDYQKSDKINQLIRSYVYKYSQRKAAGFFGISTKAIRNRIGGEETKRSYKVDLLLNKLEIYEQELERIRDAKKREEIEFKINKVKVTIEDVIANDMEEIDNLVKRQGILNEFSNNDAQIVLNQSIIYEFASEQDIEEIFTLQNYLLKSNRKTIC